MSNRYNMGFAAEHELMDKLVEQGWVTVRSSGSHGPVDIIAARGGRVLLIQVKRSRLGPKAQSFIYSEVLQVSRHFGLNAEAVVAFKPARGEWRFYPSSVGGLLG